MKRLIIAVGVVLGFAACATEAPTISFDEVPCEVRQFVAADTLGFELTIDQARQACS